MSGPPIPSGTLERSVPARAKVNLFLAVGARRPDGFHEVVTVVQSLGLADEIEVRLEVGEGTVLERDVDLGIDVADDLAFRAVEGWRALSGYEGRVSIRTKKLIPAGAGLGGGSSDAAAVLGALGDLTGVSAATDPGMLQVARTLGADVPFFLYGGTCLLSGRGDELLRQLDTVDLEIAIVNPGVPSPTGAVYAQFDRIMAPQAQGPEAMIAALESSDPAKVAAALHNNLAEAACALVPETRTALRFLEDAGGVLGASVAGSGSSAFGVFGTAAAARAAADEAAGMGWWSCATRSQAAWAHGDEATCR